MKTFYPTALEIYNNVIFYTLSTFEKKNPIYTSLCWNYPIALNKLSCESAEVRKACRVIRVAEGA